MSDLYKLYSPSSWSKRLPPDEIVTKHIEFLSKQSNEATKLIPSKLNVPYGPNVKENFNLFGTDLEDNAPIFLFVHGGYWQEDIITHDIHSCFAFNLYKNKIKSIFVEYELCPKVTVCQIQKQIEKAVWDCINYAKNCKSRGIFLAGHSAGAQLIIMLFTNFINTLSEADKNLIKDVFLFGGIYNLIPLVKTIYNDSLKLDETSAKLVSPIFQKITSSKHRTIFIIAAEYDSPKFIDESKELYEKLVNDGIGAKFILVKTVDHFNLTEKLTEVDYEISTLLITQINKI